MNKSDIQEALRARGIAFNETATKVDLEALLKAADAAETNPVSTGEIAGGGEPGEGVQEGGGLPPVATNTIPVTDPVVPVELFAAPEISEAEILAKTTAGLTREQAIEVIGNQRAHDQALEEKS